MGMQRGGPSPPERCTRDHLLHGHAQHAPPTTSPARSRRRAQGRRRSLRPDSQQVAQEALGFGIPAASDLRTQHDELLQPPP